MVTPQNISTNVVEVAKPQQQEASPPANDSGDDSKSQNASIDLSQSSHRKKLKRKIVVKNDQKSQDEMTLTDPTGRAGLQKFATF